MSYQSTPFQYHFYIILDTIFSCVILLLEVFLESMFDCDPLVSTCWMLVASCYQMSTSQYSVPNTEPTQFDLTLLISTVGTFPLLNMGFFVYY